MGVFIEIIDKYKEVNADLDQGDMLARFRSHKPSSFKSKDTPQPKGIGDIFAFGNFLSNSSLSEWGAGLKG